MDKEQRQHSGKCLEYTGFRIGWFLIWNVLLCNSLLILLLALCMGLLYCFVVFDGHQRGVTCALVILKKGKSHHVIKYVWFLS